MKKIIGLVIISSSTTSFAAGGVGVGSLIPPAVNFILLIIGLSYLIRKPAKELFAKKSADISDMINRAASKAKEAETMMKILKEKTDGVEKEIAGMKKDQENTISEFKTAYESDVNSRIEKMKLDAAAKIEAEKVEQLNDLNEDLLDLVVSTAKTQIKENKTLAANATKNIVEGL